MTRRRKCGFAWHVHHDALTEWCWDYDERVAVIRATKPANEIPTRLRLLQFVKGRLPIELQRAGMVYDKAWAEYENKAWAGLEEQSQAAYQQARAAYQQAEAAYMKAILKYMPLLEKLHAKECGCTEWNGKKLVFPKEAKP